MMLSAAPGTEQAQAIAAFAAMLRRIRADEQEAVIIPAETYQAVGTLVVGWVHAFGTDYGRVRVLSTEAGVEETETSDRTVYTRVVAPTRRVVDVAWPDGIDLTEVSAATATPDTILGSTDANARGNASRKGTPRTLEGLVLELDGRHTPVVYLSRFARASGLRTLVRRDDFIYGRILGGIERTAILGTESASELVRMASISIREEV
jgi:hypothetical protein